VLLLLTLEEFSLRTCEMLEGIHLCLSTNVTIMTRNKDKGRLNPFRLVAGGVEVEVGNGVVGDVSIDISYLHEEKLSGDGQNGRDGQSLSSALRLSGSRLRCTGCRTIRMGKFSSLLFFGI